jgi:putative NIF3 family GTP cyclohydrolase 1 type 2
LAELLCLRNIKPLYQLDANRYMGKYGELEKSISLTKFVDFVKEKLNCKSVTLSGNLNSTVNKVGICTGKGTDKEFMLAAKENGCDIYITGDVGYHDGQFAEDIGLNLIDVSHYDSENIVIPKLCEYITKNFSEVECIISQYDGQTLNII